MQFFIYICILLSTGMSATVEKRRVKFSPENTASVRAAFQKCADENGIPRNTVNLIKEGYYSENDAFKKYMFCVYQQSGYAKPDGHVIISKAVTLFPKDLNMLPIFENCDIQGADPVETTFLSFKCYQDTTPVWMAL